jgi:hypothetical protein
LPDFLQNRKRKNLSGEDGAVVRIKEAAKSGASEISLADFHLRTVPKSLGDLAGLRKVDLSGNYLTSLPDFLGAMTSLNELRLARA